MKTLNQNPQLMKTTLSLLISFLQNELQEDEDLPPEEQNNKNNIAPPDDEPELFEEEVEEEEEYQDFTSFSESAVNDEIKKDTLDISQELPSSTKVLPIINNVQQSVPDYPIHGKPLEKVLFLSHKNPWFFCLNEMQRRIETIEGPNARETLRSFRQKLHNWVHINALVSIRLNDNRRLVFYGLREWVDTKTMNIKSGYNPRPEFLRGLSQEELRRVRVSWNGLN